MSDKYPYPTEDDIFDCENGSPVDLMVLVNSIRAELARLRAVIRNAEWITDDNDAEPFCGNCGANKSRGHDEGCPYNRWEEDRE